MYNSLDGLIGLERFEIDLAGVLFDDLVSFFQSRIAKMLSVRAEEADRLGASYTVTKLMSRAEDRLVSPNIFGAPTSTGDSTRGINIGAAVTGIILTTGNEDIDNDCRLAQAKA